MKLIKYYYILNYERNLLIRDACLRFLHKFFQFCSIKYCDNIKTYYFIVWMQCFTVSLNT